jgi:hypothetical protein
MSPDARAMYDKAMSAVQSGQANVHKNEIKLSFQLTGPGFTIGKSVGGASPSAGATPSPTSTPAPIEPASAGGSRMALILGACAAAGLLVWLTMRGR